MYIISLMDSQSLYRCGGLGLFLGRGGYEFAFQFFEGSNEELLGR